MTLLCWLLTLLDLLMALLWCCDPALLATYSLAVVLSKTDAFFKNLVSSGPFGARSIQGSLRSGGGVLFFISRCPVSLLYPWDPGDTLSPQKPYLEALRTALKTFTALTGSCLYGRNAVSIAHDIALPP